MGAYNHKYNTLFIHIPKVAGTSIGECYFTGNKGHDPIWVYRRVLRDLTIDNKWDDIFKFTFVRNPWDRFVSAYFHGAVADGTDTSIRGFRKFVQSLEGLDPEIYYTYPNTSWYPLHKGYLPQHFFLAKHGEVMVDSIFKYENLDVGWEAVCAEVGEPLFKLPHKRKGEHLPYQEYYSYKERQIISELYRKDIEMFDYEF